MDATFTFPFLALVGQAELKTALILALINPRIGGVLLSGPYGVGKTTAVRGLLDIMPLIEHSCTDTHAPRDEHTLSTASEKPTTPLTRHTPMRLVELPLNARIEDVVGGINERMALEQQQLRIEEGVLAKAHKNVLYIDEINLLDPPVIDVILDAAAQGRAFVRRGAVIRLFPAQFVLIGSMNPEEGLLRPQIMDRFGLRVWVSPLTDSHQRLTVYQRVQSFHTDPAAFRAGYAEQIAALREEVAIAREILPHVTIPPQAAEVAFAIIQELKIPSHRAEIALLEAARARAAADFRNQVTLDDIHRITPLALRHRRSNMLESYAAQVQSEDALIETTLQRLAPQTEQSQRRGKHKSAVRELEDNPS